VFVEQRLTRRNLAKRARPFQLVRCWLAASAHLEEQLLAAAERAQRLDQTVGDAAELYVAESVDVDHVELELTKADGWRGPIERDKAVRIDGRADLLQRHAGREVGGGRAEDVAAMEGRADER